MKPNAAPSPAEKHYQEYNQVYKQAPNKVLVYISVIFMLFGLLALSWALPFPHLGFLGKYSGYINWASFLIALLIYLYLRLSPMVSYLMLFMLFGFSYGIIQLEQWQKAGGPSLLAISAVIFALGLAGQILILKAAKVVQVAPMLFKSTVWFLVSILKGIRVRY